MAVGEIGVHAHLLVGMALKRLADDHDCGDVALFSAVFSAWLGWATQLHCPGCEQQLIEAAQAELAAAQQRRLH